MIQLFDTLEGGSSGNGCDDTFHGGAAFSEVESQAVRDSLLAVAAQTKCYLTFHSYGQYWLTPWGYTSALPSDYNELVKYELKLIKFENTRSCDNSFRDFN
jgi:hypothetical protein